MPGPPITDRPHTISSAYEKGHQRPSLQAYTFNPPDKTIPEEEEVGQEPPSRPPVPQRLTSMERPSLPGKTEGVQAARQKLQAQGTQVGKQSTLKEHSVPGWSSYPKSYPIVRPL